MVAYLTACGEGGYGLFYQAIIPTGFVQHAVRVEIAVVLIFISHAWINQLFHLILQPYFVLK